MNKKLVGGVIAAVAVVALVVAFVVTRPDNSMDSMDMSNSKNQNEATQKATAETNEVSIKNFAFSPATIKVKKGTTVTWTNEDSIEHTVTGDSGGPDSELIGQGDTYTYTFNEAGTFDYHCKPHPNMVGKVIVEE
jgi:amicyanin